MKNLVLILILALSPSILKCETVETGQGEPHGNVDAKAIGASGSLITRICSNDIVKTGLASEKNGVGCMGSQGKSIRDMALVVFNKSSSKINSRIFFQAYDQMENRPIGERISSKIVLDTGYNAYPLSDLFGSEENISKITPFSSSTNPSLILVTILQNDGKGYADTTNCTAVVGGGSAANFSISVTPLLPVFFLNKEETNYSTFAGAVSANFGYQYINKQNTSFGISGVLIAKDKLDSNNVGSFIFWPGISLSASKITPSGIRYSADFITAYQFEKVGHDKLILAVALNFGLDLLRTWQEIKQK